MEIFRTKTTTPDDFEHTGLKKCLTAFDLTFLGIGAIIGTGIFVLTGIAAATQAGPAVVLSFVIAGIACAFAALAYAELAAAVTTSWSGYFNNALTAVGFTLPETLTNAPSQGGIVNLPAAGIVLILMVLLMMGMRESARTNMVMVFVKLLTIAVFIGVAVFHVNPENWSPFMPYGWSSLSPEGKPVGVLAGAAMVFFAYIGFDAVSTAAEEAKNPQRDVPFGIIFSLIFCTVIYIVVSGLLTGMVPYSQLNVPSPVAHSLQLIGVNWASALVATGVIAGLTTVMLVLYYGLTRVFFAMSRDGLLPPFFAEIHQKTHTPIRVIAICGVIISLIAGFIPLGDLAELVNIGTLAAFVLVCLGVVILRIRQPHLHRPFKNPLNPVFPLLGAISCSGLMAFLPVHTWIRFAVWLAIGVIIYFSYSIHHSKLGNQQN